MATTPTEQPQEGYIYLLFVMEAIPISIIDEVLEQAHDDAGEHLLRLADDRSVAHQDGDSLGTVAPIDPSWTSPFIGKTSAEMAEVVRNAPHPVNKRNFAVLDLSEYQRNHKVMMVKIVDGEAQGIPITAEEISTYLIGHRSDTWAESWRAWREEGRSL